MTVACPAQCGSQITPSKGGFPEGTYIPTHFQPNGTPCGASQSPFGAFARLQTLQEPNEGSKGSSASEALFKGSPRRFLNAPSPDENIRLWLKLVEEQTKKQFQIDGDFACVVEEIGEGVEASSLPALEDALCDTYVATLVSEELILRHFPALTKIRLALVPDSDAKTYLELAAIFAGRLANYVRKPKTEDRALAVLGASFTAKAAIKRELDRVGLAWGTSIQKVLDVLDKRLETGYTMNHAGSAVKNADL